MQPDAPVTYANVLTWSALIAVAFGVLIWSIFRGRPEEPPPASNARNDSPEAQGPNKRRAELHLLNETLSMLADELDAHARPGGDGHRVAYRDKLTGLPNQAFLKEFAARIEVKKLPEERCLIVLRCDIDGFDDILAAHGTGAADKLMVEMARRLQRTLRANDIAVHLDADKFAVLIEARKPEAAILSSAIARRLIEHAREPLPYNDTQLQPSLSIGAAFWPEHAEHIDAVVQEADTALRMAKRTGRSGFEIIRR